MVTNDLSLSINMSIFLEDEQTAMKVIEALSRVGTGLALDGVSVSISINTLTTDKD